MPIMDDWFLQFVVTLICAGLGLSALVWLFKKMFLDKSRSIFETGIFCLFIWVMGSTTWYGADMTQRAYFAFHDPAFSKVSYVNSQSVRELLGIDDSVCVIDDSEYSRRCQFAMKATLHESNELLIAISNAQSTKIRGGRWPFAFDETFSNNIDNLKP